MGRPSVLRIAFAILIAGVVLPVSGQQDNVITGVQLRNRLKHLLLDSRVVAETNNARLVVGRVAKDEHNPLFHVDKPWENALNNLYPNIAYDETERRFQLWYKCVLADSNVIAKMMPPRTINKVGWFLCYATSRDGIVWEKPELGLHGFDGSTKNNAVARDVANVGVCRDPHDPDPARRYKMIYDIGVRLPDNMRVRFSPDGVHWSEPVKPDGLGTAGDTHSNMFWDDWLGRHVLITRLYIGERLVSRAESTDFLKWTQPALVLRSTPAEGKNRQAYCMPAFPYANGYLGFVMMYNVASDQTVDCELVWSPDSVTWQRVAPGTPFIPRGAKESYDGGCIYAQAGPPVIKDGRLWIYYGGSREKHRGWKRHCLPCLARLRVDGFAGYEPQEPGRPATILTPPMRCTGDELRVSADVRSGSMRVEIVGESGHALADCEPIVTDVTDGIVRWKNGKSLAALKGKAVRLKFELNSATLYAFSGMERIASPK
ncbi:MAG: hypothetical protein HZA88_13975 [Verrucomicrobia bacterium]|nr:hypothetical protein [Verrucomicrobiota bacterium]